MLFREGLGQEFPAEEEVLCLHIYSPGLPAVTGEEHPLNTDTVGLPEPEISDP